MSLPDRLKPKTGVTSIKLALTQDVFNEVSNLITPIAETMAMDLKLEDQHFKQLGVEFGSAKDIRIESFKVKDVVMEIMDGFVAIAIDNVDFLVSMNMRAVGGDLGRVQIKSDLDVRAKLRFGLTESKHCTTDVYDISAVLKTFQAQVGTGVGGELIAETVEGVEYLLKPLIQNAIKGAIASALEDGLDSVLVRNWDITGKAAEVFYKLSIEFVKVPVITKAKGVEYEIGIDSFFNRDRQYEKAVPVVSKKGNKGI